MGDVDCGDCDCGDADCDCDCGDCDCDCDCDCCECFTGCCDGCCDGCKCFTCNDCCWVPQQHLIANCFWDCVCADDEDICCCCCQKRKARNQPVYDISSQVESQGHWQPSDNFTTISSQPLGGLHPHIHPSGLSPDQINFSNELNKPNADDPPPSYEQAVRIAPSSSSHALNALTTAPTVPSEEIPPVPK